MCRILVPLPSHNAQELEVLLLEQRNRVADTLGEDCLEVRAIRRV